MAKEISYEELAKRVGDMILCNEITNVDENIFDNIENGEFEYCFVHNKKEECDDNPEKCEFESKEIYQYYIINKSGADYLKRVSNEIILYSELLDVYVWGITHFGTPWSGVFTNIKA